MFISIYVSYILRTAKIHYYFINLQSSTLFFYFFYFAADVCRSVYAVVIEVSKNRPKLLIITSK